MARAIVQQLAAGTALAVALGAAGPSAGQAPSGELRILYWQAASILNPYLSGGRKDWDAAAPVLEPLASYDETGQIVPRLAESVPTVANGGVSPDFRSVTWRLKPGVTWSDGTPFTAEDVVFTAAYCMHPQGGCNASAAFADIASVTAVDPQTVRIDFSRPVPFPYLPFVGSIVPVLQKAQFEPCLGAAASACTEANFAPIGTGPYVVESFRPNDVATYTANPAYREPGKPGFARILLKGGGDAASAARAVLETGEFDYAWNLQLEPEVLARMEAAGAGTVISAFGSWAERIMLNQTDPDPALGEARATLAHPHPALSDPAVREAMALAVDRELIAEALYGAAGRPTCNLIAAPAAYVSDRPCPGQDIARANAILDAAGWARGADGVRSKNGVRLSFLYQTSTNSVRQSTQSLVKQWWQEIGIETELRNIAGNVFFGGDPASPDTYQKFFADVSMYTTSFDGTDPSAYMGYWTCANVPSPANNWLGRNTPRHCNPDYDALVAELAQTADLGARAALIKRMNDMVVASNVMINLVHRGTVSARATSLEGVRMNAWDTELWNIADWRRAP